MDSEANPVGTGRTKGREATRGVIPGRFALSVGKPELPCPDGWSWTALSDVAQLESGHTPSRRHPEYWDGGVCWIGIKDAVNNHGRTIGDTYQKVSDLGLAHSSARLLPAGTVCLSRTASVGFVVMMGHPMATSQDFVNWVCGRELEPAYLKYVLLGERDSLFRFASGTTHQTIYYPEAKAFHALLPPVAEQRAIAHVLGTLDDKIDLNRRMNETLEAMARTLFKSWFVDFDPVRAKTEGRAPYGMDAPTAALFPDSFEDSELGPIPKGWSAGRFGAVASQRRDTVKPDAMDEQLAYIGLQDMPRRSIALSNWGHAGAVDSAKSRFSEDDVLFGKLRPYFHKVGVPAIDGVASTDIIVITPKEAELRAFVLQWASSDEVVAHATAVSAGTRMPRTKWKDLAEYLIPLPPPKLTEAYSRVAEPMIARIKENIHESKTLADLRDLLLPKLLSGEIHVAEVPERVESVTKTPPPSQMKLELR